MTLIPSDSFILYMLHILQILFILFNNKLKKEQGLLPTWEHTAYTLGPHQLKPVQHYCQSQNAPRSVHWWYAEGPAHSSEKGRERSYKDLPQRDRSYKNIQMKCTCMHTYTHTHRPTLIEGLVFKICVLKFRELLHDISHLAHSLPCLCRGSCIL